VTDNERLFDVRHFGMYLMKHMIVIVCVSLACAVAMFGYKYKTSSTGSDVTASSILNDIVAQNKAASYDKTNNSFTDADCPDGACNSSVSLYVDFNFSELEGEDTVDFTTLMSSYAEDVRALVVSEAVLGAVIENLKLTSYEDMQDITVEKLGYMINRGMKGAHSVYIVVTDNSPERAQSIASEVTKQFIKAAKKYMNIDDIEITSEASLPDTPSVSEASINKKALLKYAIVGFAAGFILTLCVLFTIYVMNDSVRTERDLAYLGLAYVGTLTSQDDTRLYARIADAIRLTPSVQRLYVLGLDAVSSPDKLAAGIETALKDDSVQVKSGDVAHIEVGDTVLVAATYGQTKMETLKEFQALFANSEIHVLGTVLMK